MQTVCKDIKNTAEGQFGDGVLVKVRSLTLFT